MTRARKTAEPRPAAVTKATPRVTEPKAKPEKAVEYPIGTTVDLDVDPAATAVLVERPDGSMCTVLAGGGRAVYVLDQLGVHITGGLAIRATQPEVEQP